MAQQSDSSLPNTPRRDQYGSLNSNYSTVNSPQFVGGNIDPRSGNVVAGTRTGASTGGNTFAPPPIVPVPSPAPAPTPAPPPPAPAPIQPRQGPLPSPVPAPAPAPAPAPVPIVPAPAPAPPIIAPTPSPPPAPPLVAPPPPEPVPEPAYAGTKLAGMSAADVSRNVAPTFVNNRSFVGRLFS